MTDPRPGPIAGAPPARERILGRIRAALADVPATESPADVPVPRDYDASRSTPPFDDLPALLAARLADYKALVHRVAADALPEAIAGALRARDARTVAVPGRLPAGWLAASDATAVPDDPPLTAARLDELDAVLTGCAVAVAETGTIVLDAGMGQGRRALTLVPDYHLCVVTADRIVGTVPQAVARLDPTRPLTWISGSSATSDIEFDRVEGVHGPRTLEVLLVDG